MSSDVRILESVIAKLVGALQEEVDQHNDGVDVTSALYLAGQGFTGPEIGALKAAALSGAERAVTR